MNTFNILSSDSTIRNFCTICRGNVAGSQRRAELPAAITKCLEDGHKAEMLFELVAKCFDEYEDKFGMDAQLISLFAKQGISPNTRVRYTGMDCTMLQAMVHGATVSGLEKYMAKNEYSVDSTDQYGRTALGIAATLGNDSWWSKCLILLDAGFVPSVTSKAMKESTCADKIIQRLKTAELDDNQRTCFRNALGHAIAREAGWLSNDDKPEWIKRCASVARKAEPKKIAQDAKVKMFCPELKEWCNGVVQQSAGGLCVVEYRAGPNEYRTRKLSVNSSNLKLC